MCRTLPDARSGHLKYIPHNTNKQTSLLPHNTTHAAECQQVTQRPLPVLECWSHNHCDKKRKPRSRRFQGGRRSLFGARNVSQQAIPLRLSLFINWYGNLWVTKWRTVRCPIARLVQWFVHLRDMQSSTGIGHTVLVPVIIERRVRPLVVRSVTWAGSISAAPWPIEAPGGRRYRSRSKG